MKILSTTLFLILAVPAMAQQTVVIPSQTIPSQTVQLPPIPLPTGMNFDGKVLTVPELKLTGGAPLQDGKYIASVTSGVLTFVPYVSASSTTSPAPPVPFNVVAIPAMAPLAATATYIINTGTAAPAVLGKNVADVYPLYDVGAPFAYSAVVTGTNQVTVRIWNRTASNAALLAGKWEVVVR